MGKTISSKVTDEQYIFVSKIAETQRTTISDLIKQAILTARIENDKNADRQLKFEKLRELNRIGNNLNQISRHLNTKKIVDRLILDELIKIREKIQC